MSVTMRYGGESRPPEGIAPMTLLNRNTLGDGTTTDTLTLEAGCVYLLFTKEYNHNTGAYRGAHIRYIVAPEEARFGTDAPSLGTVSSSTNSGVTITANNDSTVSIKQSSSTYDVRYALYKVGL